LGGVTKQERIKGRTIEMWGTKRKKKPRHGKNKNGLGRITGTPSRFHTVPKNQTKDTGVPMVGSPERWVAYNWGERNAFENEGGSQRPRGNQQTTTRTLAGID